MTLEDIIITNIKDLTSFNKAPKTLPIMMGSRSVSWSVYWTTLTFDLIMYRKGIRSGNYVIDYSADGGVTWELNIVVLEPDEDTIIISIDDGVEGYRQVIRDGDYCIDYELTSTGFEGAEDTDWENVYIIMK